MEMNKNKVLSNSILFFMIIFGSVILILVISAPLFMKYSDINTKICVENGYDNYVDNTPNYIKCNDQAGNVKIIELDKNNPEHLESINLYNNITSIGTIIIILLTIGLIICGLMLLVI